MNEELEGRIVEAEAQLSTVLRKSKVLSEVDRYFIEMAIKQLKGQPLLTCRVEITDAIRQDFNFPGLNSENEQDKDKEVC